MSLTKHLLNESFFLKLRYKDHLFLYILKELAERYGYDTNRWLDMSQVRWERDPSLKLQKILKKAKFEKLMDILKDYNQKTNLFDNVSPHNRKELKEYFREIWKKDKYSYNDDPDKDEVETLYHML